MKVLILIFFINYSIFANEYMIISHNKIENLSMSDIRAIFLKKMKAKDDIRFVPINLSLKDSVRNAFEKKFLKMNSQRLKSYWAKQHYLGHRPPHSLKSQKAVIAFIKKVEGSISYVDRLSIKDDNVNILYKWSD